MKIVKARLVKKETEDKQMQVNPDIPDGKEYFVDLDVKQEFEFLNQETRVVHKKMMVRNVSGGYLPVELLEFGEEVKLSDFIQDVMWDKVLEQLDPNKMNKA